MDLIVSEFLSSLVYSMYLTFAAAAGLQGFYLMFLYLFYCGT